MTTFFRTVAGKLVLASGISIAVILAAYTAFNVWTAKARTEADVIALATAKASSAAEKVAVELTQVTSAGSTLAGSISGYIAEGGHQRSDVIALLKQVAPHYDSVFGVWMTELLGADAPRMLDGTEGSNSQDVFAAYWTKNDAGQIELSTWTINPEDEYYNGPLSNGTTIMTAPYLSETNDLLTSVGAPVVVDGKIVGIAGVDIKLTDLTNIIDSLKPFEGGHVMLIASNGSWLANPDKSLLMTEYADAGADQVKQALSGGEMKIISDMPGGNVRLVYPFTAPGMHKTWAAVLDVPSAVFTDPVWEQTQGAIIGGLVIMFVTLAAVLLAARSIVNKPVTRLSATMKSLAEGDIEVEVRDVERADEIGEMAKTVQVFRENAIKVRDMTEEEAARIERTRKEREQMMQELQRAFGVVVDAAIAGDFSKRVETEFPDAELNALARSINNLVDTVDRGLGETGQVLSALAETDLTQRVHGEFHGAFSKLKTDTNAVADKLTEVVGQIKETSRGLKVATGEILSGANDLSERTTKQAATIEETSAAMEQLASTVMENAKKAGSASEQASVASRTAEEGGEVMQEANEAMERISNSSSKISNIIGMIDDIAFQTNLLALNASVEAARAGEAGKGFAVVAVEVRRLAQSAAEASSDVKTLIEQSGEEVAGGTKLVASAAEKLSAILDAVRANASQMSEIAKDSREQASSIEEVNVAVRQMDEMTQHNAALVEETNAAIEQTESQASELDRIVEVFTLAEGHQTKAPSVPERSASRKSSAAATYLSHGNAAVDKDWSEF